MSSQDINPEGNTAFCVSDNHQGNAISHEKLQRHAIINSCKSMTRQCTSLLFIDNIELLVPKRHKKIMLTKQWYIKSVSHKSIMQCHDRV